MELTKEQKAKQKELRERELDIVNDAPDDNVAFATRNKDRQERWVEFMKDVPVPDELVLWEAFMTKTFGRATCAVGGRDPRGHIELPWLTALMVVRYGESEHFWPKKFGEKDVARAVDNRAGWAANKPLKVHYLPREG